MSEHVLKFWAKTSHDKENLQDAFHPLICHMIDVACVAEAMWMDTLPDVTKRRLAKPFGLENDLERAGKIIVWLAGLHDLGKCSPPFALRGMHNSDAGQPHRLYTHLYAKTDFDCERCLAANKAPHGFVTSISLPKILEDEFGFPNRLARELSELIGGHHGIFAKSGDLEAIRKQRSDALGGTAWDTARKELVESLRETLEVDPSCLAFDQNALDRSTGMIFAGLVSVADWIGSDASFFKCRIEDSSKPLDLDINEYLRNARSSAQEALTKLGWDRWPRETTPRSFDELFDFITDKRDLQQKTIEIAESVSSPGVYVIEAPMGEGKTEAAMYLADALNARFGTRGIYFALPTMATSDQMFGRVADFLKGRFKDSGEFVNLMLQHGHASLSDEFADNVKNFRQVQENIKNVYSDENDDRGWRPDISNVAAAEWFTYRKRGLLAPFGVGTIDQILFAALQTKHVFVRLFGLAHRTIIIDEVHAYDAYMTELLERLLEWLAALGSPVVILSATLPKDRRNALIKAYLKGSGQKFGKAEMPTATDDRDEYPRVSYALAGDTEKTFNIRRVETSPENARKLKIEWKDDDSFVEELKTRLAEGGCAAIICNTVARAQDIYDRLKQDEFFFGDASDGKPKLDLLHARYRFKDRQEREKRALLRFGKVCSTVPFTENGRKEYHKVERPEVAVLVSTQIIEQSLDIDFDLMISEIAPVDLLLQRSGRLQRHDRESDKISEVSKRPIAFRDPKTGGKSPSLWILKPPLEENNEPKIVTEGKEKGMPDFGKSGLIYDKHILLRTWLMLRNRSSIKVPKDVEELIEAVYGQTVMPDVISQAELQLLEMTRQHYVSELANEEQQAQSRYINHPRYRGELSDLMLYAREEESPELHPHSQSMTRLVEPTAQVVCLWESNGRIYVDEALQTEVDLKERSPREIEKQLVLSSVGVSSKAVVFEFFKEEPPQGWQRSPLLRRHRVLKFGPDGKCEKFGRTFELHPEKGLLIYIKEENEMPQFDLRKESWIPCLTKNGQREMSLVDVLTEAHNIRELVGDSPPVTIALHRLLLAILHRIYRGPQDEDKWNSLYTAGRFDAEKVTSYFDAFHDRFDLFHETHPFYQTPAVREKVKDGAVIKLYFHSGNNATLFDHTSTLNPKELLPAEAARLVVMIQAFDTGGQITGDNGADSAKAAPLIQSAVALVRGETLFETLMLNLHRYCGEDGAPFVFDEDEDLPAWERDEPTIRGSRLPSGPVDLLSWQSRRVALEPEENNDGKLVVRKAVVMAGHSFSDGMEVHTKETMMAFRKSNDGRMYSVGFSESRDLWRNSLSLLKAVDISEGGRPRMLDWISQLRYNGYLQRDRLPVDFCGIAADKAKLLFWNHERFDLPLAYLEDNDLTLRLGTCLEFSESIGSALRAGVKVLADALETERETFSTEANFWSQMEMRFHRLLGELPEKGDEEMVAWFRDTQRFAKDALRKTVNSLSGSAAENKAAVAAENALHSAIGKAINGKANEWAPYLPERFEAKGGNQ